MKKRNLQITSVLSLLLVVGSTAAGSEGLEEGFVSLCDGTTLNGWTTADGKPVTTGWVAEDGVLTRVSRGGSIFSIKEYGDFDLRFEWRIASRGNSGVKYRVRFYERGVFGRPGWLGCEYQLWDDNRETRPNQTAGALYALFAPNDSKELKPLDEFNASRIVAVGPRLEHWLNGKLIVEADTGSDAWRDRIANSKFGNVEDVFQNRTGRIQLQDHGSRVWFRNIRIRELSEHDETDTN